MGQAEILDTWLDFSRYWRLARFRTLDEQILLWQTAYMENYPELLRKQVKNYEQEGLKWKDVARKIFPSFQNRFRLMRKARNNILRLYENVYLKAVENLGIEFDVIFIVYVGVGCGAGWADLHEGKPAVLLGLENVAEERWHTRRKLEGLMAHEIGHLTHMFWRGEQQLFEEAEGNPLLQLYVEGFAQRCEHIVLGKETWHMAQDREWLSWCKKHKRWLAKEFLNRVKAQAQTREFFGSWFSIKDKKQTGYFLGHEFIHALEKARDLKEIALLKSENVQKLGIKFLERLAEDSPSFKRQICQILL
ncbi:MAG: hypothetical protein QXG76_03760 [Candidatus Bathyarchaeia archaeon]